MLTYYRQNNPIEISKNDKLIVGEEYKGNANWVDRTHLKNVF